MGKRVKKGVIMLLVLALMFSMTAQAEIKEQAIVCQAETWGIKAEPYITTCNISQQSTDFIKVGGKEYHGEVYSFIASDDGMLHVQMERISGVEASMTLTTVNPTLQDATEGDYETWTKSGHGIVGLLVKTNQRVWLAVYGTQETFTSSARISVSVLSGRVGSLPVYPYGTYGDSFDFAAKSKTTSSYVMPFVAYATGLLDVRFMYGYGFCEMYLRDATKKVTTKAYKIIYLDAEHLDGIHFEFGVVKGRKYELVVKYKPNPDPDPEWDRNYDTYKAGAIEATLKPLKYPTGSTKSKAETIKRKAERQVAITPSTGTRWYKIKVTKKGKVSFTLDTATTGTTKFKVYNSKGKEVLKSTKKTGIGHNLKDFVNEARLQKNGKLSAGTYYVKVYGTKGNSGMYRLTYR